MHRLAVGLIIATTLAFAAATPQFRFRLPNSCTLPFKDIAPAIDPFVKCDSEGRMTGHAVPVKAKRLQSAAKNNLCAGASTVTVMHFDDFTRLEDNTDPEELDLSADRDDLRIVENITIHGESLGEGSVVRLIAMMRTAHVSNCRKPKPGKKGGELVNCQTIRFDSNDLHIVLMPLDADEHTSECESVTAEMIPHFRPAAWSDVDLKKQVENPVRLTGQLFYDDAHRACKNGKGSPARRTVWEIHPVYKFEVCTTTDHQACKDSDAGVWMPYEQWVTQPGVKTRATGSKARDLCDAAGNP